LVEVVDSGAFVVVLDGCGATVVVVAAPAPVPATPTMLRRGPATMAAAAAKPTLRR
jgi:hypothetical protein